MGRVSQNFPAGLHTQPEVIRAGRCVVSNPENTMLRILLIVFLFLLLLGALPTWPYSSAWGYYPSGGLGLVLLTVIILVLAGKL